jgi:hypothetical protein
MVGTHLYQEISPRVPRHVNRVFLDRPLFLRLRITSGVHYQTSTL